MVFLKKKVLHWPDAHDDHVATIDWVYGMGRGGEELITFSFLFYFKIRKVISRKKMSSDYFFEREREQKKMYKERNATKMKFFSSKKLFSFFTKQIPLKKSY